MLPREHLRCLRTPVANGQVFRPVSPLEAFTYGRSCPRWQLRCFHMATATSKPHPPLVSLMFRRRIAAMGKSCPSCRAPMLPHSHDKRRVMSPMAQPRPALLGAASVPPRCHSNKQVLSSMNNFHTSSAAAAAAKSSVSICDASTWPLQCPLLLSDRRVASPPPHMATATRTSSPRWTASMLPRGHCNRHALSSISLFDAAAHGQRSHASA